MCFDFDVGATARTRIMVRPARNIFCIASDIKIFAVTETWCAVFGGGTAALLVCRKCVIPRSAALEAWRRQPFGVRYPSNPLIQHEKLQDSPKMNRCCALFALLPALRCVSRSARAMMEAAEVAMVANPTDQKALDQLLQAQATFEAVGGHTQDRTVAQVMHFPRCTILYVTLCTAHRVSVCFSRCCVGDGFRCHTTSGVASSPNKNIRHPLS